jgi:hypothetical protein
MQPADALRDTALPLYGLDDRFMGRRWVASWDGDLRHLVLAHGYEDGEDRVDVGVASWPPPPDAASSFLGRRWVDVETTLATELFFAGFEPPENAREDEVRDLLCGLWAEAKQAGRGVWAPASLWVDRDAHSARRLDHDGHWMAHTRLGDVILYVLSRGAPIDALRLVRLTDPARYA